MRKLKYASYAVVMQEVPNEISLAINISDCPYRCKGCHSQYLWEYTGAYLTNNLEKLLNMYIGMFSIFFVLLSLNIQAVLTHSGLLP